MKLNQLHNTTNPYQTDALRVLTVCSAGLLRSPTMANVLHSEYGYNTRSAGINDSYALIPVTSVLVFWADEIVCAESWMEEEIKKHFEDYISPETVFISLDIPDNFGWGDKQLKELVLKRYAEYKENNTPSAEGDSLEKDDSPEPTAV